MLQPMDKIIDNLKKELFRLADEKVKISAERYFKNDINLYDIKTPDLKALSKLRYKDIEDKSKSNIFGLCSELFRSGNLEESIIGCWWSYNIHRQYLPEDMKIMEHWVLNYLNNWATCNTLKKEYNAQNSFEICT